MRILFAATLAFVTAACASSGGAASMDQSLITRAEVDSANQANAYELVRTLRPRWLQRQGPSSFIADTPIQIYIDGNRMGGPSALETVPKIAIEEIRYFTPSAAQARWGLNHTNGAISVTTRRG